MTSTGKKSELLFLQEEEQPDYCTAVVGWFVCRPGAAPGKFNLAEKVLYAWSEFGLVRRDDRPRARERGGRERAEAQEGKWLSWRTEICSVAAAVPLPSSPLLPPTIKELSRFPPPSQGRRSWGFRFMGPFLALAMQRKGSIVPAHITTLKGNASCSHGRGEGCRARASE